MRVANKLKTNIKSVIIRGNAFFVYLRGRRYKCEMSNVTIQKRGKYYQYKFETAKIDGKRKFSSKSGFRTKAEAEKEGIKAYNEYMNTGHDFTPSDMSYSDLLDYWLEKL